MNENNDKRLLEWITGESLEKRDEAFVILYRQYYPVIEKFILNNKGTAEDAKDIFQDGMVVLYNQIMKGAFNGQSSIKTYLYSICRNLWLKKITRKKETFDLVENHNHIETDDNALHALIGTEREAFIADLLSQPGEECNKILKLFYYDKLSMQKIMEKLQLASVQVAKNKKMKCLKKIRKIVLENNFYSNLIKN